MNDQPHDKFFKVVFSDKEIAIEYFEQFLPLEQVEALVLEKLEITSSSYVNPKLEENYSDIVYNCPLKGENQEIQLCLLLEHKSYPVKYPHLQLLQYILNGWNAQLKQKQNLKLIIPIVFYHGEKPWALNTLDAYFGSIPDWLAPYLPRFDYHLTDLTQFSDEAILNLKASFLINSLVVMKHARELNFLKEFVAMIIEPIGKQEDYLRTSLIEYFIKITQLERKEFTKMTNKLSVKSKNEMLSTYDMAILEGRKEGKKEMQIEAIKGFLLNHVSPKIIASSLNVDLELVLQIKSEMNK